ncbi:MAG: nicotinate-nucleotide--dimethylbenzimidazole phosphoribosyltransferase [Veillonellales bacterium]
MDLLHDTLAAITGLDELTMSKVQQQLNRLSPAGGLGRLGDMAAQYAGITGEEPPSLPRKCLMLLSADHGVSELGVSAYPVETTVHMTKNYLVAKGAGANALANYCHADMTIVDMGIAGDVSQIPGLIHRKIAYGTQNFTRGPAMTRQQAIQALETGIQLVAEKARQGYRCFSLGEMGIGNTTSSAAIAAAFSGMEPKTATGRGTGISDGRLQIKIEAVRQGLTVNRPNPADGLDVLTKVGGFEIGGLAGVILGAAANRCLVIIDGFNATAAALIATALQPLSKHFIMGSHLSAEPAHRRMLRILDLEPYIDMGLRLGEGTGASLVMDLLDAAIKILHETAAPHETIHPLPSFPNGNSIQDIITTIGPLDSTAMEQCQLRLDNLSKPLGSLHALEQLACKMAGITHQAKPNHLKKALIVMAADHATSEQDRNTAQIISRLRQGNSISGVLARHGEAKAFVVDLGVKRNLSELPGLSRKEISSGTEDITAAPPAMSRAEMLYAIQIGMLAADTVLKRGNKIIGLGSLGTGSLPAALAVLSACSGITAEQLSSGFSAAATRQAAEKARHALLANPPELVDPLDILTKVGGWEIAGLVGVILAAAAGRAAVVLDGLTTVTAALIATRLAPQSRDYLVASHFAAEPGLTAALQHLGIPAYLHLNLNVGEGVGAILGMRLIDAGLHVLNDMKTFGEAKVAVAQDGPGSLRQRTTV